MGRGRRNRGIIDELFEVLSLVFGIIPPWVCVPVAVVGLLLCGLLSAVVFKSPSYQLFGWFMGTMFAFICLIAGVKGYLFQKEREAFLAAKIDLDWVRSLTWRQFEHQVAEVYRGKGFKVEELGGGGPDGGVDLRLYKDGQVTLVQCKHWKSWRA